jgi:predicted RNase H-like HicB family nuclease
MKNKHCYPAVLEYDKDGISVSFPDFPSCLTCGNTEKEALKNAREALALHLYGMEQDQDQIPSPTPSSEIVLQRNQTITLIEIPEL